MERWMHSLIRSAAGQQMVVATKPIFPTNSTPGSEWDKNEDFHDVIRMVKVVIVNVDMMVMAKIEWSGVVASPLQALKALQAWQAWT